MHKKLYIPLTEHKHVVHISLLHLCIMFKQSKIIIQLLNRIFEFIIEDI